MKALAKKFLAGQVALWAGAPILMTLTCTIAAILAIWLGVSLH